MVESYRIQGGLPMDTFRLWFWPSGQELRAPKVGCPKTMFFQREMTNLWPSTEINWFSILPIKYPKYLGVVITTPASSSELFPIAKKHKLVPALPGPQMSENKNMSDQRTEHIQTNKFPVLYSTELFSGPEISPVFFRCVFRCFCVSTYWIYYKNDIPV